ncbi:exchanger [Cyanidiococcus yangmingshanensis]|uniref:Exchanger n=1 Tax=Cyanidiococcus yangmingshanensis TaxID=2690220 RepID=A0A7J7IRE0_9RHOD|nr:exchanger [Cyanidiococcus yangmingshanensis]
MQGPQPNSARSQSLEPVFGELDALLPLRESFSDHERVSTEHLELFPEHWSRRRPHQRLCSPPSRLEHLLPYSWMRYRLNVLLPLVPLGLAGDLFHSSPLIIFLSNFLGIFPLGILLGRFTEDIAWYSNAAWGALLNATFGNAVELIFAIAALRHNMTDVLKATMLGSIIGNELFVTGFCFLLGGFYFREQSFASTFSDTNMSILYIATIGLLFPTVFDQAIHVHRKEVAAPAAAAEEETWDLRVSRWTAVSLLLLYIAYLVFELYTHAYTHGQADSTETRMQTMRAATKPTHAFGHVSNETRFSMNTHRLHARTPATPIEPEELCRTDVQVRALEAGTLCSSGERHLSASSGVIPLDDIATTTGANTYVQPKTNHPEMQRHADVETDVGASADGPEMSLWANILLLLTCTLLVSLCTDRLVGALDAAAASLALPPTFISFILMPLVGNIAEHLGAVSMALQNKMDLAVRIAIGSAVQIGLLVFPVLVLVAWMLGTPLTLQIPMFGGFALIASTVVVVNTMRDSASNWLEGLELLAVYLITCVCFYYTT